jgi:hypothetical protein
MFLSQFYPGESAWNPRGPYTSGCHVITLSLSPPLPSSSSLSLSLISLLGRPAAGARRPPHCSAAISAAPPPFLPPPPPPPQYSAPPSTRPPRPPPSPTESPLSSVFSDGAEVSNVPSLTTPKLFISGNNSPHPCFTAHFSRGRWLIFVLLHGQKMIRGARFLGIN